ncbi:unnamed protein product [Heligmosomoides polygyrus]|uniref:ADF-H domain-containing protein n=1 Tax=Heligmosomoides polygyrus TaxID=6339 RepID=A0A183F9I3_HELPZ|nr:unnamed protein product [Heligmosomoides polygyrus]
MTMSLLNVQFAFYDFFQSPRLLLVAYSTGKVQGRRRPATCQLQAAQLCDANNCDALVNLVAVSQFAGEDYEIVTPEEEDEREEPGNEARDVAPSGKEKKKEAAIASDSEV